MSRQESGVDFALNPPSTLLSPRLLQAADWVRPGVSVADIGTDHGYLCAHIACKRQEAGGGKQENEVLPLASRPLLLACDIAEKPLQNAARTLERYGLIGHVELRLSDGLDSVEPCEADDILMLGMGGTLIARLLDRCGWIKDGSKRLILQPMSRAEELRVWLCENGFEIIEEAAVREGRRLYVLIRAVYVKDRLKTFPYGYEYFGELPKAGMPEAGLILERTAARLGKKSRALEEAGKNKEAEESKSLALMVNMCYNEAEH